MQLSQIKSISDVKNDAPVSEIKAELRRIFTEKRKALSEQEKKEFSKELCINICSLDVFKEAEAVLSFYPLSNEPDVRGINEETLRLGKILALPKCVKGTREMNFYVVKGEDDLEKGSFSIMEPKETCDMFIPAAGVKTLCIVPALAYDKEGYRLGYGGGYYDRYLSRYNVKTVGAVYPPFLADKLPRDEFDLSVDRLGVM